MNKKLLLLTICACFTAFIFSQNTTLLTINGKEISKSSFEYLYHKNNTNNTVDKKSLDEYLDMFIAFKLKVAEAEALKMDTAKSFISELEGYRRQSAAPYLVDNEYKLMLEKEAYERMKMDVELGHIFIKLENTVLHDTLDAYNKALAIVNRVKKEDFGKVAEELSEDPKSKTQGGYLGYLSALKTIYSFESGVYKTPVGEVAGPIRSMFGYHVIKVIGQRPSRGKLLVAHILKQTNDTLPENDTIAQNDIQILYTKIQAGEDFGELAKQNSDDAYSAQSNGQLSWIEIGSTVKEFEDAAYTLKNIGDVSKPVKTKYGWHIIKLLDKKSLGSFDEEKAEIEKHFTMGERADMISESFNKKLKKEYNYTIDKKAINKIQKLAKELSDSIFYIKGAKLNKVLFAFADKSYTQAQLVEYMKAKKIPPLYYDAGLNRFSEIEILAYENSMLERKHLEFRNLIQEYKDGILLFNISNIYVWEKAMKDTEGLQKFFEQNKANYTWDAPRYKGRILYCKNKEIEKKVRAILQTEPTDSIDNKLRELNKDENAVKSDKGLYAKGAKTEIDYYVFRLGDYKPTKDYPIVFVDGELLQNPNCYQDVKGKVMQDYQTYLDKEWVKQLREKYSVKINQEVLKTIQ